MFLSRFTPKKEERKRRQGITDLPSFRPETTPGWDLREAGSPSPRRRRTGQVGQDPGRSTSTGGKRPHDFAGNDLKTSPADTRRCGSGPCGLTGEVTGNCRATQLLGTGW